MWSNNNNNNNNGSYYQQQPQQAPYGGPQNGQWGPPQGGQWNAPYNGGGGGGGGGWNAPQGQNNNGWNNAPQGNQWNAPPPQQQQQSYGQGWNAPPQQQQQGQGWNAPPGPPQGQYAAPPQQQQQYNQQQPSAQFGAPQGPPPGQQGGQGGGPRYLGVSIPAPPPALPLSSLPGYNAQFDAERIRKATKGFGTDERTLIDTMAPLDAFQMEMLSRTFEQMVGKTLKHTLEKELSSWLEYALVLLSLGPLAGDVYLLHRACAGMGTHEDLLTEVLLGRSNEEIFLLKEAYQRTHHKDLVSVVRGELSMKTERMFNMALTGMRDENPYVDQSAVQRDVETLYRAGAGKIGTDEIAICGILLSKSDAHLQAIAQAFPQRHRIQLSQMIKSEFSGHMRDALYHVARGAEMDGQGVVRDAEMLEAAMAGAGTKDERLIYRLVRAHWNRPRFGAIKNQFQAQHRTSLRKRVEGETTGKYEKALVAIIDLN